MSRAQTSAAVPLCASGQHTTQAATPPGLALAGLSARRHRLGKPELLRLLPLFVALALVVLAQTCQSASAFGGAP
jgi:hypothetical protein